MGKIDDRFIILLNVDRVLSTDQASAINTIGALGSSGDATLAGPA
jgi:hypothetical protein